MYSLDPFKYAGYERDRESGMDYVRARYYMSGRGRWLTPDPLGGGYVYADNMPTTRSDPSGLGLQYYCHKVCYNVTAGGSKGTDCQWECESFGIDDRDRGDTGDGGDDGGGRGGGGGGGGGGSNATISALEIPEIPWYDDPCIWGAIKNGISNGAVDMIGLIPEGGIVSRAVGNAAGWRGIVATQQGTKTIQAIKAGTAISSTANGANDTSSLGTIRSITGAAGIVPVLGTYASALLISLDVAQAIIDISDCP